MQLLFMIGRFKKKSSLWNRLSKWTEIWKGAPMEGSVWSFLKTEWKVSDTGSVHWASSLFLSLLNL